MIAGGRGRGFALIQITLLAVLGAVVALCTLSQWIFQSQLDRLAVSRDGARRLSEGALHLTIAKLLKDPSLNGTSLPQVNLQLPSYPDALGYVALNSSDAGSLGIPLSVNNLKGTVAVPGRDNTVVAPATACLVGVGRYRGREIRTEAVLYVPAFPYVISSSLSVNAISGLKVFGVPSPGGLDAGYDPAVKVPGHIATGAADQPGKKALLLQGVGTVIEGDAQACGSVEVDDPARVNGSIRPQSDAPGLPRIDAASLDTTSKPGNTPLSSASLSAPNLSGFNSKLGDLSIQNGLKLTGGVLFVKGNLDIQGGVQGKGAIIATGTIQINGGSSLSGDNQTAIVGGGAVTLQGSPGSKSEYRGLVYSGGNLNCKYTNIAGAVVVNSQDSAGSVNLEQASLVESSPLAQINIPVQTVSYTTSTGRDPRLLSPQGIRGYASGNAFAGLTGPMLPVPAGGVQEVRTEFVWYPARGDGSDMQIPPGFHTTQTTPWVEIAPDPITDAAALGSVRQINVSPGDPVTGTTQFGQYYGTGFYITGNNRELADEAALRSAMADAFSQWFPGCSDASSRTDNYISDLHAQLPAYLQDVANCFNANSKLIATSPPGSVSLGTTTVSATATVPWKLDLGDFYNFADQVRIKSWLEL